jgi:hypothetical protein
MLGHHVAHPLHLGVLERILDGGGDQAVSTSRRFRVEWNLDGNACLGRRLSGRRSPR